MNELIVRNRKEFVNSNRTIVKEAKLPISGTTYNGYSVWIYAKW